MAEATLQKEAPKKSKEIEISLGPTTEKVIEGSKEHMALTQKFDPGKKYMFELAMHPVERELPMMELRGQRAIPLPNPKFQPYRNLTYTSQVVWNGQRRIIRYYDGCDTIFSDKQPKEKEVIDAFIKHTKQRVFIDGKLGVFGDDRMLLLYMYVASWNAESEFRTRTANQVYVPSNSDKQISSVVSRLDQIEEALKYAREASELKMNIHADYLLIPDEDYDSGNKLTEKERRILYREKASKDPKTFIESYGDKSIEIKYYIGKAFDAKTITIKGNECFWGNGAKICDTGGIKSRDAVVDKLFEFSQSEDGSDFLLQLKALYN